MSKPEGVECGLTLLTGWEGIRLYALTFTTTTRNNFCSVISPLELNTRSIPVPIVMLVLRVRYLWFRFNTCAAVIFATIRCLRYFKSDSKSLKITSPLHGYCTQPPFFALLSRMAVRYGTFRICVLHTSHLEPYRTNVPYQYHYKKSVPYQRTVPAYRTS